jgi:hypothetical protein
MPRAPVMTQIEVNQANQLSETLVNTLSQHEFVALPTRVDDTHIAVRTNQNRGVICCDILVFRQVNKMGKALRREVALLVQMLENLQSQLPDNPHYLHSTFHSHAISFLGKKAHVLTNNAEQPLYCQMVPLLLYQTDEFLPSIRERATAYPVQVLQTNHLDEFLTQNLPRRTTPPNTQNVGVHQLKHSYRNLGLSLIIFPLFIGITGILASLGLLPIALVSLVLGILVPLYLLHRATKAFEAFRIQNVIPVQAAQPNRTSTFLSHQEVVQSETQPPLESTHPAASSSDEVSEELATVSMFQRRNQKPEVQNQLG